MHPPELRALRWSASHLTAPFAKAVARQVRLIRSKLPQARVTVYHSTEAARVAGHLTLPQSARLP